MLATKSCDHRARVRNVEFVSLAPITNVHAEPAPDCASPTLSPKVFVGLATQIVEFFVQPFHRKFIQGPPEYGARIVLHDIADQNAEGGERARKRRHDHPRDAQARSQFAGMQPASAAEGHQHKPSRVVATLNRNHANGFLHGRINHANDSRCKLFEREFATLLLQPGGNDSAGAFQVEREIATKKTMRLQASQDQIRIRDRGLSAATIADGTRISARGFRPDAQGSSGIEARNRTSACAHGVNVEHGHTNGQARNLSLTACIYLVVHQSYIGRSATHVERNNSLAAAAARRGRGSHHSSRGARKYSPHRFAGSGTQSGDSTTGLHDKNASDL